MKKKLIALFSISLVLGLLVMSIPSNTVYGGVSTPTPVIDTHKSGIADGDWQWTRPSVHGQEVSVDLVSAPAPVWLQLLTSGLKIDGPAKICHPFKGGQYKWIGEIRQWVAGKWVKLDTVNDWVPSREGQFMSCAVAPKAGTYALFGYYTGPAEKKTVCQYSTADWEAAIRSQVSGEDWFNVYAADVPNLPAGTVINYQLLSITPEGATITGATSGSGVVILSEEDGLGTVFFTDNHIDPEKIPMEITLRISAEGCSKDITFSYGQD